MLPHQHLAAREDTAGFFTDLQQFTGTTTVLTNMEATNTFDASIVPSTTFPSQSLQSIITDSVNNNSGGFNSDLTTSVPTNTQHASSSLPEIETASHSTKGSSSTDGTADKSSGASSQNLHKGGKSTIIVCSILAISFTLPFL